MCITAITSDSNLIYKDAPDGGKVTSNLMEKYLDATFALTEKKGHARSNGLVSGPHLGGGSTRGGRAGQKESGLHCGNQHPGRATAFS